MPGIGIAKKGLGLLGRTKKDAKRRILKQMDKAQKKFYKRSAIILEEFKREKGIK